MQELDRDIFLPVGAVSDVTFCSPGLLKALFLLRPMGEALLPTRRETDTVEVVSAGDAVVWAAGTGVILRYPRVLATPLFNG